MAFQSIMGREVKDQIQSIDQVLTSLQRKGGRVLKLVAKVPVTEELLYKDLYFPIMLCNKKGLLEDVLIFLPEAKEKEKGVVFELTIQGEEKTEIFKFKAKKGFNNFPGSFTVSGNTLVCVRYLLEGEAIAHPIFSISFKEDTEDASKIKP